MKEIAAGACAGVMCAFIALIGLRVIAFVNNSMPSDQTRYVVTGFYRCTDSQGFVREWDIETINKTGAIIQVAPNETCTTAPRP